MFKDSEIAEAGKYLKSESKALYQSLIKSPLR